SADLGTSAPEPVVSAPVASTDVPSTLGAGNGSGDITDAEFEELLDAISGGESVAQESSVNTEATSSAASSTSSGDDISDDEFEALLDQLHGSGNGPGASTASVVEDTAKTEDEANSQPAAPSGDITDDEFDALLDQLHGKGKGPGVANSSAEKTDTAQTTPAAQKPAVSSTSGDLISDDEFEQLLDDLHGKGKAPTPPASSSQVPSPQESVVPPAAESATPKASTTPKAATGTTAPPSRVAESGAKAAPKAAPAGRDAPPAGETTVRVDTQRLDEIMNMVGELVLVRNRLVRLGDKANDEVLSKAVGNLDVVTADLQSSVMKTRMQPIKKVFGRFPRVVRDLARSLKKEINLELQGEDTDLDKNLVEALADPLVHLVRNSVDHGIELPDAREANGKPRVGKVVLAAVQEGDHILLSITDDGGGMDPDKLRGIAVEKGLMDEDAAARLPDSEAFALIFAPGFSTKKEISDVSGRGVGMDVVKTKITQLNGSIEIHSAMGEGTRISIKVPLTLAIMPTLMIMLGRQTFALPLVSVNEIFHMDLTKTHVVDGRECVTVRDKAIPVFHLKRWLVNDAINDDCVNEAHVVIVSVGTQRVGFVVDQLIGQEEVVIKPLGKMLHGTPGMAGATITGDGTIALILDVPSMLDRYAGTA
ncbi:chemotaxis protein CheA, partial [Pseudomaricurvus sp.]|uniref:chemotaxis protein CheA n=1 Tax=Pseudomaricurvus sp. TaxID=2004510 RepID=UPI003F6C58BF